MNKVLKRSVRRNTFHTIQRISVQSENRLGKYVHVDYSIGMFLLLFVNRQSLALCSSIDVIYFENCYYTIARLNSHLIESMYYDVLDKTKPIYCLMKFQCYHRLVRTAPNDHSTFQSDKRVHFWEFV